MFLLRLAISIIAIVWGRLRILDLFIGFYRGISKSIFTVMNPVVPLINSNETPLQIFRKVKVFAILILATCYYGKPLIIASNAACVVGIKLEITSICSSTTVFPWIA